MRTGLLILSLITLLAAVGCGQGDMRGEATADAMSKQATTTTTAAQAPATATLKGRLTTYTPHSAPAAPPPMRRDIVRNADIAVRVKAIEPAEHQIEKLITSEGGYVDNAASTDLASDHPQMQLALRIPVQDFDSTVDAIEALGVRLSKTVNSQDVTGQLIDLDARLATMQDEEHVYQTLLKQSDSLDRAMELRDKLTDLRAQIESIAGQRKATSNLAALSSVSVTLTQSSVVGAPAQDAAWYQETWGQASSFSLGAARIVLAGAMWLLALLPFWIPAALLTWRYVIKPRKLGATLGGRVSTIH